jgi:SHS2 domain-containing protein
VSLPAGHRLVPHTADCVIEAWGPDRAVCLTEALLGLMEGFAAVGDAKPTQVVLIDARPGAPKDELVALFEQVIFGVNVLSVVPVRLDRGRSYRR